MASTLVPVMADMNIKSTGKFKITIQETYRYSHIYFDTPDISNDSFFLWKIEKNNSIWKVFSNLTFIYFLHRYCNYKPIRWRYTGSAFLELKVYIYQYTKRYIKYKQISWQYIDNTFFRTPSTGTWITNKSDDGI